LQAVPGVPRLRLLASGPLPPNPSELLSSGRTKEVFAALKGEADIVLIDSPPVLPVTDALVLFRQVDATLMVFAAGQTTQKQAATALAMAKQVNAPLVGTILNGVATTGGYGSQYTYGYTSAAEDAARERMRRMPRREPKKKSKRESAKMPTRATSSNGSTVQPLRPAERKPDGPAPTATTPGQRP
jgi:Mrp family chromosome partitioning ATPase